MQVQLQGFVLFQMQAKYLNLSQEIFSIVQTSVFNKNVFILILNIFWVSWENCIRLSIFWWAPSLLYEPL